MPCHPRLAATGRGRLRGVGLPLALLLSLLCCLAQAGTTHTIRGRIVCGIFGFGISGIKLYGLPGDPKTDGNGDYTATVPTGWSGAAYPLAKGLHFDPFGRNYNNVTSDIVHNYKTTLPLPSIWGYVKKATGDPVELVVMNGLPKSPQTNSHGYYLAYVSNGASPTVTPQRAGHTFDPPTRAYDKVSSDMGNQNYTAGSNPGITVSPTAGLTTNESGGTAVFTVVLDAPPTADVTIGISSNDTSEGTVSPAGLTFTPGNWSTPQAVTITGVDDDLRDGDVAYTVRTAAAVSADPSYNGMNPPDVAVTNLDNDTPGILVEPTAGLITTENGGTAQFNVVLRSRPLANVTIPIASDDTTEGVAAPPQLFFTTANWDVPQAVTVGGVDDLVRDGDRAYKVRSGPATSADPGYTGLRGPDVNVTNLDNEGPPVISVEPVSTVVFPATEIGQIAELPAFVVTNAGGGRLTGTATVAGAFRVVAGAAYDLFTGESSVVGIRFTPASAANYKATVNFTSTGGSLLRAVQGTGMVHTIVVDNLDDEPGKRFEAVAGTWASDTAQPSTWGGDYRTAPTGGGGCLAAWHYQVKYDGFYEVLAWWPKPLATWASAAPYRVFHPAGDILAPRDQRSGGGKWSRLGIFELYSETDWRVELANDSPGTTVVADAICVRWVGKVSPKLALTPKKGTTDFGPTRIGTPRELDAFVVTNTGNGRVIGRATVPPPFSIVSGGTFVLGAGASQVVRVRYDPAAEGTHSANVAFETNVGNTTRQVRGTAFFILPPLLAVGPLGPVDFGEVLVGRSADLDAFNVTNEGDQPLAGNAVAGKVFTILDGAAFNLNPGESQTVRMRFTPIAEANYSQPVTFTSNGGTALRTVLGRGAWLVVDNADNDPAKRFEVVAGAWTPTTARSKYWATDYVFTQAGDGSFVAAWHFQVPADGLYEVAAWWPKAVSTWGASVPYTIYHSAGTDAVRVAQSRKGGKWSPLATCPFTAGDDWRVEINNNSPGLTVVADAIRLRRIGPLPLVKVAGGGIRRLPLAILAAPLRGPAPLDVLLEAIGAPAGTACTWDLGDGAKGQGTAVIHTFHSPGTYTVTLTAGGRTASAAIEVGD